jgi:hypothetical protein
MIPRRWTVRERSKLSRIEIATSTPLKEPIQILALEAEPAPVAELGGRDRALARPPPGRSPAVQVQYHCVA